MSRLTQLLRSLCNENDEQLLNICDELKDRISYDACGAKYINEEGVFNLVRELSTLTNQEDGLCTPSETRAFLSASQKPSPLLDKLFPPIATLNTLTPPEASEDALCEIPETLAQQLEIQADGSVSTSDLLKMAAWYAKQ